MSGSGISWAICKSAPRSRQITTPVPHHSVFLQAGCPSCRPTNSVKALKAHLTSAIINKQGTFSPFATPLCVYPPSLLAIHHCLAVISFIAFSHRIFKHKTTVMQNILSENIIFSVGVLICSHSSYVLSFY